jgi:hypothetical protein
MSHIDQLVDGSFSYDLGKAQLQLSLVKQKTYRYRRQSPKLFGGITLQCKEGAFIKQFLDETKMFRGISFELLEDSQPMINAQKRNVSQSKFKHMKTKHHYIRKLIFDGWCKLVKIPTKMNTADMTTKILPAKTVSIFSKVVLGLGTASGVRAASMGGVNSERRDFMNWHGSP